MKPKILFTCTVADEEARQRMERYVEVVEEPIDDPKQLAAAAKDVQGIIVPFTKEPMITREVLDACTQLELVGTTYGGVRQNVDDLYALEKGLTVIHTGASRVRPMAEYTLGMILSSLMYIHLYHHDMSSGEAWPRSKYPRGRNLSGRCVGVIGYGRIGKGIVDIIRPFTSSMRVSSQHLGAEAAKTEGLVLNDVNTIFADCEIVVLAGGYSEATHHMVGKEQFDLMQEDALFVNIARGRMVDEAAMTAALDHRQIYLALDVFEEEPLKADSRLRNNPRVLLTPHRANNAIEFEQRWQTLADEIEAFYTGRQPDSALTPERAMVMSES